MQQLQRSGLQQLQAWQQRRAAQYSVRQAPGRQHTKRRQQLPSTAPVLGAQQQLHLACTYAQQRALGSSIMCSSAADGAGSADVVRPSAKAATPPAVGLPGAAASGNPAAGSSSTSGSSTPSASSTRSAYASYSDMYKALNTSYKQPVGEMPSQNSTSSSSSSSTRSTSSASSSTAAQQDSPGLANDGSAPTNGHQNVSCNSHPPVAAAATSAAGVEDAIKKAQQALAAAEDSLSSIHKLRSAQPPNKWAGALQVLRTTCIAAAAGVLLVASHAFGLGWQWAGATLGAIGLAARAYQRCTVTPGGAVVVAAACLATLGCSLRFGVVMLAYSFTSHKLRQFKELRQVMDYDTVTKPAKVPAQDWPEVLCIVAIPTLLAVAYGALAGCLDLPLGSLPAVETWRADLLTLLQGAVLGWYACCCGDAWSRELGELSRDMPRLLTTLQPVRKGTHGAVTLLGLSAAAAGGLMVGLLFYCAAVLSPTLWVFDAQRQTAMSQWRVIPLGLIAGLFGSIVDSVLGATLQFTGYDNRTATLSNTPGPGVSRISGLEHPWVNDNLVNVLTASMTAVLTALAALRMFG